MKNLKKLLALSIFAVSLLAQPGTSIANTANNISPVSSDVASLNNPVDINDTAEWLKPDKQGAKYKHTMHNRRHA